MRRLLSLMLALCCLLPVFARAEDSLTLLTADTVEEVNQFILLPGGEELPAPERGKIRFISLNERDSAFRAGAWKSDRYNLMSKAGGYRADHTNMHNRAVYCMALSYLGVAAPNVVAALIEEGGIDLAGFGRQSFAYPDFANDILKGGMNKDKLCICCSKCTEIMRAGSTPGCVIRDKEIYLPLHQKFCGGKK